jgi:hypothetical protein
MRGWCVESNAGITRLGGFAGTLERVNVSARETGSRLECTSNRANGG